LAIVGAPTLDDMTENAASQDQPESGTSAIDPAASPDPTAQTATPAALGLLRRLASAGPARSRLVSGTAVLALALTGGAAGGVLGYSLHGGTGLALVSSTATSTAGTVADRSSLASVAAVMQPSIVDVMTDSAEGSGIIVSADGYIVTNNHVIAGARTVTVSFNSGEQVAATVVGADTGHDLAVLKVDRSGLTAATWGDSDAVRVGDTVLALGSPLGLQGTVTAGIVSALHRTITVAAEQARYSTATTNTIDDAIQTDAPINSGNSGGALANTNGEVIGITSAIATAGSSGNVGVGFAIPSTVARAVVDGIIAGQQ
jgi:putative serine protease PepD